jgi:hypothetical protein
MMYPQSNRADRSNLAVDSDDLEFCRAKTLERIPLHRRFHRGKGRLTIRGTIAGLSSCKLTRDEIRTRERISPRRNAFLMIYLLCGHSRDLMRAG